MADCPIHPTFNTLPTNDDDVCNTNGNGYFIPGSTWLFVDSSEPLCKRLFIQRSEVCGMADWAELSLKNKTHIRKNRGGKDRHKEINRTL